MKLKTEHVAELLGKSYQTVAKWRQRNQGPPYYKQGGAVFYLFEEVEEWQRSCRVVPSASLPESSIARSMAHLDHAAAES